MKLTTKTKRITSIASPGADVTGLLYNRIFRGGAIYLPATIKNVENALIGIRGLDFSGASVSMPYKQKVMDHIDDIDVDARTIGAVNTLYFSPEGKLRGTNTDWSGALLPIKKYFSYEPLNGKSALVIGAGGAARAIVYGLKQNHIEIDVFNRTAAKAKKIEDDFLVESIPSLSGLKERYDIIINATSYEFNSNSLTGLLIPEKIVSNASLVMDVVFDPCQTSLILAAKKHNVDYIMGSEMLVAQAVKQAEYWGISVMDDAAAIEADVF